MLDSRYILILLILLLPFNIKGQSKNYSLKGYIYIKGGDKYPYQLYFNITGDAIVGYSLTKWPNGIEPRIKIKGHIDLKQHTLSFTETEIITSISLPGSMCLVNTKLRYMLRGGKYFIFGTFNGRDRNNKICGEGAIEFEEPYVPGSLFYAEDAGKKTPSSAATPVKPRDTIAAVVNEVPEEVINGYHKITEGVPQHLYWNTDVCNILVWDGGVIDGDIITILLNGKEVLPNYMLTKSKKQLSLFLKEKVNTITILAGDEGTAPPNTAQMILNDGPIQHKILSFNKKGKSASIVITKTK